MGLAGVWGVGCWGGRVQGDQRSASLPGHTQCGNRWGALRACLSSPPAWARAWGQMTRWSDGQEVGVSRRLPGCQAWGRSFLAALVPPDQSSNQYLCKCSQLGKMQSARRPDPGEGQSGQRRVQPGGLTQGKGGGGSQGLGGSLSSPAGSPACAACPPPSLCL